ncbi:MAG: glycine--tRNA ligase subunit beta [Nitrospinaceae bacterium]
MPELFLEIGTEEIPAGYIAPALESMAQGLAAFLRGNRVPAAPPQTLGAPRRLTVCLPDVAALQADVVEVHKGPGLAVAYDKEGKPTKAALGFARGKGVDVSQLSVEETPKGKVICARVEKKGQPTADLLAAWLPEFIATIPFPKKMRWGRQKRPFVRPVHWIAALFDGKTLPFQVEGVESGESFSFSNLDQYLQGCKAHHLMVDPGARRELIVQQAGTLAREVGGFLKDDADLLNTVTFLVEYPAPLRGGIEPKYLQLPVELLEITMKHHQKYFPVWKSDTELLPYFITVSNMPATAGDTIVNGNQRVLKARLEDARFFYEEDQKRQLETYVDALKGVVFQKDLGTLYEKMERTVAILKGIEAHLGASAELKTARRAAFLCKADLVTQMVFEFPELQGVMGGYYAANSGEPPEVALAIKEHYQPAFAGDGVPSSKAGAFVSMADKLDTIMGCISVGLIPSGSEDPYALRRHAMGIIQILIEHDFPISLETLINIASTCLPKKLVKGDYHEAREHVQNLFRQRLKSLLVGEGYEPDVIDAVMTRVDSFKDTQAKAAALADLKKQDYFESLAIAFRRVVNILEGQDYEGGPQENLFQEPEEKALCEKYKELKSPVAAARDAGRYAEAFAMIVKIKPEVDTFFDKVMVNVEETTVRDNRKALLYAVSSLFISIADFSKIVVKKG